MPSKVSNHARSIGQDDFQREVLESEVPVLVDFHAQWCPPCRMVSPIIDELAAAFAGRAKVVKVDTDANGALSAQLGISSIPAALLFHGGEVVERLVGLRPRAEYAAAIEARLG